MQNKTNPIVIVLLVLILAGVGYFIFKDKKVADTQISACNSSTTPSIVVTSPSEGQTYTTGQQVTVSWTSCNVQNVYLSLGSGGKDFGQLNNQISIPAAQGSYQWTVTNPGKAFTNTDTNSYQLYVESQSPEVLAKSGTFTVTSLSNTNQSAVNLSNFSSKYISPNYPPDPWPPIVQHNTTAYSCSTILRDVFGDTMTLTGKQKNINGREFCVYSFSDGGAGSFSGVYTYITAELNGGGTERVDFRSSWHSCGVYGTKGDSQYDQCSSDQSTFFNNIDAFIASLM